MDIPYPVINGNPTGPAVNVLSETDGAGSIYTFSVENVPYNP